MVSVVSVEFRIFFSLPSIRRVACLFTEHHLRSLAPRLNYSDLTNEPSCEENGYEATGLLTS